MYCVWPRCAQGVWRGKNSPAIHPSWRQRGSVCSVHSLPPWCLTFTHTLSGGHIQYTCVCALSLLTACIHCLDLSVVSQTEILMRGDFSKQESGITWFRLVCACVCAQQEEISSELSDRSAAWVHLLLPSASTCRGTGVCQCAHASVWFVYSFRRKYSCVPAYFCTIHNRRSHLLYSNEENNCLLRWFNKMTAKLAVKSLIIELWDGESWTVKCFLC